MTPDTNSKRQIIEGLITQAANTEFQQDCFARAYVSAGLVEEGKQCAATAAKFTAAKVELIRQFEALPQS